MLITLTLVVAVFSTAILTHSENSTWRRSDMFRLEQTAETTKYTCSIEVFAGGGMEVIVKTWVPEPTKVMMGEKEVEFQARGKYFKVQLLVDGEVSSAAPFTRATVGYAENGAEYSASQDETSPLWEASSFLDIMPP